MKHITLYCPGDGVKENSNTITYKDISEFTEKPNGTITFKTQKGVEVVTPLMWRLKTGTKEQLDGLEGHAADAPPAPRRNRYGV